MSPCGAEAETQNSASHRIYMPSFIDVCTAVSEPSGFENVDIAWMG